MSRTEPSELAERGRRVLVLEADAIHRAAGRRVPASSAAVRLLEKAPGRLIVSVVGKSGLSALKIAATLTSTGSPASFLHPVDSLHGDLGLVGREDVAILLSKSGASDELFGLVGQLKRLGVPIIALTGDPDSPLARQSDVVLDASVTEEACPETRSEEHTSELQSRLHLVCRLLLEKKKKQVLTQCPHQALLPPIPATSVEEP